MDRAAADRAGLCVGLELSAQEAATVTEGALREEALDRALRYLSFRPRSRRELERYLSGKGYDPETVSRTVACCEAAGHVDDRAFASAFVRDRLRLSPRSTALLESELRRRGIPGATARASVREVMDEANTTEHDLLVRAARGRWRTARTLEPNVARRRLYAYLRRRGFEAGAIAELVQRLIAEEA